MVKNSMYIYLLKPSLYMYMNYSVPYVIRIAGLSYYVITTTKIKLFKKSDMFYWVIF